MILVAVLGLKCHCLRTRPQEVIVHRDTLPLQQVPRFQPERVNVLRHHQPVEGGLLIGGGWYHVEVPAFDPLLQISARRRGRFLSPQAMDRRDPFATP